MLRLSRELRTSAKVSVPLRGFRGLQERIAKSTRVVWLPDPSRFPHSSCSVVHVFSACHPGITPFPPPPLPVFGNSQNTPKMAPSFHDRFRSDSTRSSLLRCASAHSDSAMSATVTAVFRSSFQTAPGIGPFRGPCGIRTAFSTPSPQDPPVPGGQRTSPPLVSRLAHHPRTPRAVASGATSGIVKYILYNRNRHEACLDKTPSCAFITITALGRLVPLAFRHSLPVSGHFLFVVWSRAHPYSSICR